MASPIITIAYGLLPTYGVGLLSSGDTTSLAAREKSRRRLIADPRFIALGSRLHEEALALADADFDARGAEKSSMAMK